MTPRKGLSVKDFSQVNKKHTDITPIVEKMVMDDF
jgi:hypothetical protein